MIMAVPTMSIIYTLISSFVRSRNAKADNGLKDEENPSVNANYDNMLAHNQNIENSDEISEVDKSNSKNDTDSKRENKNLQQRKTKTNKK